MSKKTTKSQKQTNVLAFIDESYRDSVFVLAAALINPPSRLADIERDWVALQTKIRSHLLEGPADTYSKAKIKFAKDSTWLPEIHAKPLYQGEGDFEKYEDKTNAALFADREIARNQHKAWLDEALGIQLKHDVRTIVISWNTEDLGLYAFGKKSLSELIRESWDPKREKPLKFESILANLDKIQSNPFIGTFPTFLEVLECYFGEMNLNVDLILDSDGKGGKNRGFERARLYDLLHKHANQYPHLSHLRFLESQKEVGLQIADIHAYICCRSDIDPKVRFLHEYHSYKQGVNWKKPESDAKLRGRVTTLAFDYILNHSDFNEKLRAELRLTLLKTFLKITNFANLPIQ